MSQFELNPMSNPLPIATPAVDNDPEKEPLDLNTRLVLLGAGAVGLLVVFLVGLGIFVMVVNNWNLLNWLE